MNQGDCFLGGGELHGSDHLWIVINDPAAHGGLALIVNISTKREEAELTCILGKGDHPLIRGAQLNPRLLAEIEQDGSAHGRGLRQGNLQPPRNLHPGNALGDKPTHSLPGLVGNHSARTTTP